MASFSSTYPTQRPIFSLDASNAGRLDPRMTFTRSDTPPTYAAPSAVHYWSNEKHLSSENLLLQSSDFDTSWIEQGLTSITGGQTDPSGGTSGFTLLEDSAAAFHRVYQSVTADGELALTVYAKRTTGSRYLNLTIATAISGGSALATFDLAGGATHTSNGASSTLTNLSATQTASGNGYYKCVFKATGSGVTGAHISLSNVATPAAGSFGLVYYTGDGTSSIDVAFASLSTTGATDYNATTTSIHRQYAPSLKSVATAGQPRFEYSTDGQSIAKGILIEGQSTNLHRYGSDVGNWANSANRTVSSNAAVAPDGSLTADLVVPTSTPGFHYVGDFTVSITSGTTYTASFYVRDAGQRYVQLVGDSTVFGTGIYANYDLNDGTYSATGCTASASNVGNSWWRLTITAAATTTGTGNVALALGTSKSNGRLPSFSGNDYAGVLVWGAQLEASSFASSLVDTGTSSSTATRASDSLSVATADIGYTGGPVTLVGEAAANETQSGTQRIAQIQTGSTDIVSVFVSGGEDLKGFVKADNTTSADFVIKADVVDGQFYKFALRADTNDCNGAVDGVATSADTSAVLPNLNTATVYIGKDSGGNELNGHVKRIALYESLTDTNLQAITS